MKRRTFIRTGILLSIAAVIGVLIPSFQKTIAKMVQKTTTDLKLKSDSIDQFMKEANEEQFWSKFSLSKKILLVVHGNVGFSKYLPLHNKFLLYKNQIIGHFLLSTDFFLNKMNTEAEINYSGFYNPYKQPCYNPFSANFYPERA
jgi:hypothetical protein